MCGGAVPDGLFLDFRGIDRAIAERERLLDQEAPKIAPMAKLSPEVMRQALGAVFYPGDDPWRWAEDAPKAIASLDTVAKKADELLEALKGLSQGAVQVMQLNTVSQALYKEADAAERVTGEGPPEAHLGGRRQAA